jgi:hypothetical protein
MWFFKGSAEAFSGRSAVTTILIIVLLVLLLGGGGYGYRRYGPRGAGSVLVPVIVFEAVAFRVAS